jgi:hypothetical protein
MFKITHGIILCDLLFGMKTPTSRSQWGFHSQHTLNTALTDITNLIIPRDGFVACLEPIGHEKPAAESSTAGPGISVRISSDRGSTLAWCSAQ